MGAPLQYPLCCQTVTLYHADPAAHTVMRKDYGINVDDLFNV